MTFDYEFETENGYKQWTFEPKDDILYKELVKLMFDNDNIKATQETFDTVLKIITGYYRDIDDPLEGFRDELSAIFEDMAREEMEDWLAYEEDKADWFGTKNNII